MDRVREFSGKCISNSDIKCHFNEVIASVAQYDLWLLCLSLSLFLRCDNRNTQLPVPRSCMWSQQKEHIYLGELNDRLYDEPYIFCQRTNMIDAYYRAKPE